MHTDSLEEIEVLPLPEAPESEAHLQVPRGPDRRLETQPGPPWLTDEGIVLEDRRSGLERRHGS